MNWLSSWLKEIILVILLAAFVDLLIPNQALERYVKLVVSLFILMALMFPIVHLIKSDLDFNKMALSSDQFIQSKDDITINNSKPTSLATILQDAQKMQSDNEKQSLQMVEAQITDSIKQNIQQMTGQVVESVAMATKVGSDNKPLINTLTVILKSGDPTKTQSQITQPLKAKNQLDVKPVAPVDIQIQVGSEENSKAVSSNIEKALTEEQKAIRDQVIQWIETQYMLYPSQIVVKFETGSKAVNRSH